jgi:hypothetical protein
MTEEWGLNFRQVYETLHHGDWTAPKSLLMNEYRDRFPPDEADED